jgi:hypothetical protein
MSIRILWSRVFYDIVYLGAILTNFRRHSVYLTIVVAEQTQYTSMLDTIIQHNILVCWTPSYNTIY